jgi:hypothetical protein
LQAKPADWLRALFVERASTLGHGTAVTVGAQLTACAGQIYLEDIT